MRCTFTESILGCPGSPTRKTLLVRASARARNTGDTSSATICSNICLRLRRLNLGDPGHRDVRGCSSQLGYADHRHGRARPSPVRRCQATQIRQRPGIRTSFKHDLHAPPYPASMRGACATFDRDNNRPRHLPQSRASSTCPRRGHADPGRRQVLDHRSDMVQKTQCNAGGGPLVAERPAQRRSHACGVGVANNRAPHAHALPLRPALYSALVGSSAGPGAYELRIRHSKPESRVKAYGTWRCTICVPSMGAACSGQSARDDRPHPHTRKRSHRALNAM